MKTITRDDTEHGQEYVLRAEADDEIQAAVARERSRLHALLLRVADEPNIDRARALADAEVDQIHMHKREQIVRASELWALLQLREALGDPNGRLMQDELVDRARQAWHDAERYRWLRHGDNDERCIRLTSEGLPYMLRAELLDRCIDEAMADDADDAAHTVAAPAVGAA